MQPIRILTNHRLDKTCINKRLEGQMRVAGAGPRHRSPSRRWKTLVAKRPDTSWASYETDKANRRRHKLIPISADLTEAVSSHALKSGMPADVLMPAPVKTTHAFDPAIILAIRIALDATEAGDSLTSGKCVAVLALHKVREYVVSEPDPMVDSYCSIETQRTKPRSGRGRSDYNLLVLNE